MPATTPAEVDALFVQLQRRIVENGDWDRIIAILHAKLSEHGWLDDLRHQSKEYSRAEEGLPYEQLLEQFASSQNNVPIAIKRDVFTLIRQYLEKQVA